MTHDLEIEDDARSNTIYDRILSDWKSDIAAMEAGTYVAPKDNRPLETWYAREPDVKNDLNDAP